MSQKHIHTINPTGKKMGGDTNELTDTHTETEIDTVEREREREREITLLFNTDYNCYSLYFCSCGR